MKLRFSSCDYVPEQILGKTIFLNTPIFKLSWTSDEHEIQYCSHIRTVTETKRLKGKI